MQGWPDFFARGPNLQENKDCKNLSKKFGLVFLFLSQKNRPIYGVLLQNYVQKQKSASLKFVTWAAKKLWMAACGPRTAVWPCLS
jgi:hypothetical protein